MTALLLGGLAVALTRSHSQSRTELEQRLDQRATIAAALIEATVKLTVQSSAQSSAASFSGPTISKEQIRHAATGIPGMTAVVADSHGHVLAAWPADTAPRGGSVLALFPETRRVASGSADSSIDSDPHAAGQMSVTIGFATPTGRRVLRTTYPRAVMLSFLNGYLRRIADANVDDALVIDRGGDVLGYSGDTAPRSAELPSGTRGRFDRAGVASYFSSAPVSGTRWRIVITIPQKKLYAPITGASTWLPWALFAGFAAMAAASLLLLLRLSRGTVRLHEVNRDLEVRNDEVRASERAKSDFLATMSHELRTPLNGIIGFAELMHDGRVGPVSEQHKEYLGDILSSSNHLRRLIDDVLDLSKIEAGKMDLRPERVEVAAIIDEACVVMASLAVRKGIHLTTDVDPSIGIVDVDPGKLKQVLFNYLSNAVKFTPEGGNVTVSATPEGDDHYRIVVADDGPGIAKHDMDRLWSAFQQLETGPSRRYGGTGLGLSLTRRIVEAQGGEVGVETVEGQGSRFWVVLPRVARLTEPTEAPLALVGQHR